MSLKLDDGRTVTFLAYFDVEELDFPVNARVQIVLADGLILKTYEGPEYYCAREKIAFGVKLMRR